MSKRENIILTCCGFHRSATSVTAHWVHKSGITMGNWLMPGAKSNLEGHFEDMPMVSLNNQLLKLQGTSWLFHDEVILNSKLATQQYLLYIQSRDRIHQNKQWGVKDPRLCLFLPEWHEATNGRGRYLIVIRHWKECVQSLLKRDLDSPSPDFQTNPNITAQMWYSYNYRLLEFVKANPNECFILEQSTLNADYELPEALNNRFNLDLIEGEESPYIASLVKNTVENNSLFDFIDEKDEDQLETLWEKLIGLNNEIEIKDHPEKIIYPSLPKNREPSTHSYKKVDLEAEYSILIDEMNHSSALKESSWIEFSRKSLNELELTLAEKALEMVIVYGNPPPYVYSMLAGCKYAINKKNEAILLYDKAIGLNPNNSNFFLKLGNLYLNEGNNSAAKKTFLKGIENNPENSKWLRKALSQVIPEK